MAWNLTSFLAGEAGQKLLADADSVVPPSFPDVAKTWYTQTPPEHMGKALDNVVQDSKKVAITYYESASISQAYQPILEKAFFDGDDITAAVQNAAQVMDDELQKSWTRFQRSW